MNHTDHVNLLKPSDLRPGGTWADLGAGSGAFTLALRELVGAEAEIHAIDKVGGSLRELERAFARQMCSALASVAQSTYHRAELVGAGPARTNRGEAET